MTKRRNTQRPRSMFNPEAITGDWRIDSKLHSLMNVLRVIENPDYPERVGQDYRLAVQICGEIAYLTNESELSDKHKARILGDMTWIENQVVINWAQYINRQPTVIEEILRMIEQGAAKETD